MSSSPVPADAEVRRFTVTVGPGVLTDEQAARVEAAIQKTLADQLADFDLAGVCTLVDPIRELEKTPSKKGFDWRDVMFAPTAGLVALPTAFSLAGATRPASTTSSATPAGTKSFVDAVGEAVRQAIASAGSS
jgi:hypothetical protein